MASCISPEHASEHGNGKWRLRQGLAVGLGAEKVNGHVSQSSKVGGRHGALAHACERAAAGYTIV